MTSISLDFHQTVLPDFVSNTAIAVKPFFLCHHELVLFDHWIIPICRVDLLRTKSPDSISYLHIDLNAVKPTMDVLSFFLPKLSKNGVILFDDYGWDGYLDTKLELDRFFKDQSGLFLKLPTGQAIYFCR